MTSVLDPTTTSFTRHALDRLLDMQVEPVEIAKCLSEPDETAPSAKHKGAVNHRRGNLCLGVRLENGVKKVITALWASHEAWLADLERAPYADVKRREHDGSLK